MNEFVYNPSIFNAGDIRSAKNIILTPEAGSTTDERWEKETPYLIKEIEKLFKITSSSVILDYGCGIGRLSKALLEKYDCTIFGADISPNMRGLAAIYTNHNNFIVGPPSSLKILQNKFDLVLSVWVLQHCVNLSSNIKIIQKSMKNGAGLFVVNNKTKAVPTTSGQWIDDGEDVHKILSETFKPGKYGKLNSKIVPKGLIDFTFKATYTKI